MVTKFHQFENYEWLGWFYYPDRSLEFSGKLTYNPEDGVCLEFLSSMSSKMKEVDHLYGTLINGTLCTLIGDFDPRKNGMSISKRLAIYNGKSRFSYAVFGRHVSPEQLFSGIKVNFTGFQEFCIPEGFKKIAIYEPKPMHTYEDEDLVISIISDVHFEYVDKNFANRFHCENENITKEISDFFSNLYDRYPKSNLISRVDIKWFLQILSIEKKSVDDILVYIRSMYHLLSLLLFHPVRPVELVLLEKNEEGYAYLDMLISMPELNKKTINILMQRQVHQWMPITPDTVFLPKIFKNWIQFSKEYYGNGYDTFTAKIANDFGIYYEHSVRADFVMLLTQLEQITNEHKMKSSEKYNYPISLYDKSTVLQVMTKVLCLNQHVPNVGAHLTELRSEVAHVGRPRKYLKKLSSINFLCLCKCLDIIIVSHIYTGLEVPVEVIQQYQEKCLKEVANNFQEHI